MIALLLAFGSGFANEAMAVLWVHAAERGWPIRTAICSVVQALALVVGIGESVHDWHVAPAFVLGYASGAYAMVWLKSHAKLRRERREAFESIRAAFFARGGGHTDSGRPIPRGDRELEWEEHVRETGIRP